MLPKAAEGAVSLRDMEFSSRPFDFIDKVFPKLLSSLRSSDRMLTQLQSLALPYASTLVSKALGKIPILQILPSAFEVAPTFAGIIVKPIA